MNRLPVEILNLIFPLLVSRDQLECMLVCRQWEQIIKYNSLFRVIYIHNGRQLHNMMRKVERDQRYGEKVEQIRLEMSSEPRCDEKIITLFPNIRDFSVLSTRASNYDRKAFVKHENHPWCENIEKIVETCSDFNTLSLLFSGACKSLTYISVTGQREDINRYLMRALSNTSSLQELHLSQYSMTFHDLEQLHEKSPLLHTLLLQEIDFYFSEFNLDDIEPATSIKRFRCTLGNFNRIGGINSHILYMRQKYTHLEKLEVQLEYVNSQDDGDFIDLAIEQRQNIVSYMKILGPQLKVLSIIPDELSETEFSDGFDMNIFDECRCQIRELNLYSDVKSALLGQLANSTQINYIQILTIHTADTSYTMRTFLSYISRFSNLKELSLYFPYLHRHTLKASDLLYVLNGDRLETLRLHYLNLNLDTGLTGCAYYSLKELCFNHVTFDTGLVDIFSDLFPKLKKLKLDRSFEEGGIFILPYTDLTYLEVIHYCTKPKFNVLVITLDDNQRRLYTTSSSELWSYYVFDQLKRDQFSMPPILSQQYDESMDIPTLTVACKSVDSVCITTSRFKL